MEPSWKPHERKPFRRVDGWYGNPASQLDTIPRLELTNPDGSSIWATRDGSFWNIPAGKALHTEIRGGATETWLVDKPA